MATTSDQKGETTPMMVKRASSAGKENQPQLPCPRCDSSNTKFCYYNNYNFSQPRHFCKGCRRYWTHGGALRDIPVGGGSRRSSTKRPRTWSNSSSPTTPLFLGPTTSTSPLFLGPTAPPSGVSSLGSFGSLLTAQGPGPASGFLAFGGFGFEDVGASACFGVGRGFGWASFSDQLVDDGSSAGRILGGVNTWQLENGGGAFGGDVGDCSPWPDLAISTPGHGL